MQVYLFIAKDSKGNEVIKQALYARDKKIWSVMYCTMRIKKEVITINFW